MKKRKIIKRCLKLPGNVEATLNDNHNKELEKRPIFKGDRPYEGFQLHFVDTSVEDAISEALKLIDDPDKKKSFEDYISRMRKAEGDNNKKITLIDPADSANLPRIEKEGIHSTVKAMPTLDYLKKKDMCYDCETREDLIRFIQEMGWHSDSFYYHAGAKQTNVPIGGVDELFYDYSQLDDNSKEICKAIRLFRGKLSRTIDEVSREDDPRFKYILAKRMFELGREFQKAESVKYKKITKAGADRIKGRNNAGRASSGKGKIQQNPAIREFMINNLVDRMIAGNGNLSFDSHRRAREATLKEFCGIVSKDALKKSPFRLQDLLPEIMKRYKKMN